MNGYICFVKLDRLVGIALAVGVATLAGAALGAATPTSPVPGAVVRSSQPLFSWTLPIGEQTREIAVATSSTTNAEGALVDEDVVVREDLDGDTRLWRPPTPLPADSYWWVIGSADATGQVFSYSAPSRFTIPLALELVSLRRPRNVYARPLLVTVRFRANVERVAVTLRVRAGRRVLWRVRRELDHTIGKVTTARFRLTGRPVQRGTRIRFGVELSASGS